MQEVTCFHCRSVVEIAPDSEHCSSCGEDLRGLLSPEHVSQYFCTRANDLLKSGQTETALHEVERGIGYYDLADLRLLAAILSEELDRYDQMRTHVAAIPVDDSYRSEAEWLLRSHQERQRALREGAKEERNNAMSAKVSPELAEILGFDDVPPPSGRRGLQIWTAVAAMLIVAVGVSTWLGTDAVGSMIDLPQLPDGFGVAFVIPFTTDSEPQISAGTQSIVEPEVETSESASMDATEGEIAQMQEVATPEEPPVQSVAAFLIPTPTPDGNAFVVNAAMADANPRRLGASAGSEFDLERYFRSTGNESLAELPLEARLHGDELSVNGVVTMDRQRRQIEELLESVPGVNTVNTADLFLRPLDTYTVQQGDTLYSIVFDIYGDYDRADDVYRYNLGAAVSPDDIKAGDELRIPPTN